MIVPAHCLTLLDEIFQYDEKRFNDPLRYHVREDPLYHHLSRYPVDVQTFPKPILFMAQIIDHWAGSPMLPEIVYNGESMYISVHLCLIAFLMIFIFFLLCF